MNIAAIIPAAGVGSRAGFAKNKILQKAGGVSVVARTVAAFAQNAGISRIVVCVNEADREDIARELSGFDAAPAAGGKPITLAPGGATRTESVKNALCRLAALPCPPDYVLIHDAARPFVSQKVINDCIDTVRQSGSAVCALPCTDTAVLAESGFISDTVERDKLFTLQTPQGFYTEELKRAYALAGEKTYTDDSSLYAAYIGRPHIVAGESTNRKLTYAADFSAPKKTYCGVGIDTHAFGKAQDHIVLAGVKIPSDTGLIAHSDGDVLLHAVMDALLSAAGLRDIGHYFPDTDGKWKDADSRKMLSIVRREIEKRGFTPVNLSVAVQAQKPRLAAFVPAMCENLAADLGIPPSAVGITVGTNEGLGYVGEGKGITVTAYCSLEK